jgi:hypothetical protein
LIAEVRGGVPEPVEGGRRGMEANIIQPRSPREEVCTYRMRCLAATNL